MNFILHIIELLVTWILVANSNMLKATYQTSKEKDVESHKVQYLVLIFLRKCVLFHDDTDVLCSSSNIIQLENIVCSELYKLQLWFAINKTSLHITKTNLMLFSGRERVSEMVVRIKIHKCAEYLIDESLNRKKTAH